MTRARCARDCWLCGAGLAEITAFAKPNSRSRSARAPDRWIFPSPAIRAMFTRVAWGARDRMSSAVTRTGSRLRADRRYDAESDLSARALRGAADAAAA